MNRKYLKSWRSVVVGVAGLGLLLSAVLVYIRQPISTPAMRGYQIAQRMGCFSCHGPSGTGGVPNPGSEEGDIPAWNGGMAMMYIEKEEEIREWILYGSPKRMWKNGKRPSGHDHHVHGHEDKHSHEDEGEPKITSPGHLISMPAYEGLLNENELQDLIAYYKAVAAYDTPPSVKAQHGYEIASRLGCFGCHGPGGRCGIFNPRSFKGYIPPWDGKDFEELVKSDEELRQWILDGKIPRFESNPIATYFTQRQIIQMPAYRNRLRDGELEAIIVYIHWLRSL